MYSRRRRPPTWRSSVTSRPGSRLLPAADASRRVDVTTQGLIGVERVLQLSDAVSPAIGASSLVTLPSRGRRSTTAGAGAPPSECSRPPITRTSAGALARAKSEVVDNPARVADNPNESRHVRRLSVSQWPTFTHMSVRTMWMSLSDSGLATVIVPLSWWIVNFVGAARAIRPTARHHSEARVTLRGRVVREAIGRRQSAERDQPRADPNCRVVRPVLPADLELGAPQVARTCSAPRREHWLTP